MRNSNMKLLLLKFENHPRARALEYAEKKISKQCLPLQRMVTRTA